MESNFECTHLYLILINRLEVAGNTKTEDDFNKGNCKMTELMKEVKKKNKRIKLMYLLKKRKIRLLLKKTHKTPKCLRHMSKLSQRQERTGGLIKIMSSFMT